MSATNSTANYSLPIFVSSDVPSWLTDWNGAMGDIDTAIAAAKAVADSALLASGNNTSDITTIQGQITSLQTTVGTHTTQIGTISGNINTINSLIGNGTPTTTDQTIIGAINELHANQGDLADLTTTDKTSLVNAINEVAGGGGSVAASAVSYDNTGSGLAASNVQDAIDEIAQGGGSGKVLVASGTAGQTWAQQLTALQTAYNALSSDRKREAYLDSGNGKILVISDYTDGDFVRSNAGYSETMVMTASITNAVCRRNINGSTFTSNDDSNTVLSTTLSLYA